MPTIHARTCHLCEANCGVLMTVEDGKVTSVKGNPDHVLSEGYICPKATAIPDLQNDPDRLRKPVKKVDGDWVEISWDTAFEEIAEKFHQATQNGKVGGVYLGNPSAHNYSTSFSTRNLLKAWGKKNVYSASTLDQFPHMIMQKWVYGHNALYPVPDIDRTQYMVIVGGNPLASNGSLWTVPNVRKRIQRLQERGGKLVVIDPRRSETAKVADAHHFIRPGTDTAFFLGLLIALKKDGLIKPGRVEDFLSGWDTAWQEFSHFDLSTLSDYCGIPVDTIRDIARELGSGQPAILYGRMGVSVVRYGTLNHYLIQMINIATGNLDREGGLMFPTVAIDHVTRAGTGAYGRFHSRISGQPECLGELPTAELAAEITTPGEGQIGALLTIAGNPVLSAPGGQHIAEALDSLDLIVSLDPYITETSCHADYILPPLGPLERDHYPLYFTPMAVRNFAAYSPPLFEPEEGAMDDWEIMFELTCALEGLTGTDKPVKRAPRDILNAMLQDSPLAMSLDELADHKGGVDMGAMVSRLPDRLQTDDKYIQCAPSTCLDDLKLFSDELSASNRPEFSLIGRRHIRSNNSWLHNSHRLIKGPNRCTMMINPTDAERLGLSDGDIARVFNHVGSVKIETELTDDLMPGVISIPHGFGHGRKGVKLSIASQRPGVSVNDLTDPGFIDKLSGNAVLNGVPVEIEKIP